MGRRLTVASHLSTEELEQRYKSAKSGDETQALLYQALQEEPPEGGFWNGRKVADWLSERWGHPVHRQRGWEILKPMDFSLKVPRPDHQHAATEEEQRVWGKKSAHTTSRGQSRPPRRQ